MVKRPNKIIVNHAKNPDNRTDEDFKNWVHNTMVKPSGESKGIAQRLKEVVDAIEIQVVRLEKLM